MKATQELTNEHGAVLAGLKILDKVSAAITEKNEQAPEHLEQLLDFFKGFMDDCHHGKEEDVLFPELERRGVKRDGGPIGVLLAEHEVGREHVRAIADGLQQLRRGDDEAATAISEHARALHEMLREHIRKESDDLFPTADRLVPDDVAATLAEKFDVIERERVGEGKHEAYHAMLHDLKDRYGIA
ncbi:MAG: hemerythrin domain-containing protein [Gaiellaceae bacterium]